MKSLTTAEIDIKQLIENYNLIYNYINCDSNNKTDIMCILKANAYGHGSKECAKALYQNTGAKIFGVANLREAIEIKPYVGDSDILILGYSFPSDVQEIIDNNIIQTIFSYDYAKDLADNIKNGILRSHIKLNTGMNRLGYYVSENDLLNESSANEIIKTYNIKKINIEGIFTHFANSDNPLIEYTEIQYRRFNNIVQKLESNNIYIKTKHTSNSAGIINFKNYKMDMVRAGIILYGLSPSYKTETIKCKPVMELKTTISQIHNLKKGDCVSYGSVFVAEKEMKTATLTIGYGDGFIRAYSGINNSNKKGFVYIKGIAAPIIGRICMDQCIVDISHIENVKSGDIAVIFDKVNTADLLAETAQTINYEVTTILTDRVKRIYI